MLSGFTIRALSKLPSDDKLSRVAWSESDIQSMGTARDKLRRASQQQGAFTLLEILIAIALVAILMAAALPYMHDALTRNREDEIKDEITALAEKTRGTALTTGNTQELNLSDIKIPKGWKLEIERMSDKKFHPISSKELWNFNSEGICDPISLRLIGSGSSLIMKFDPITAQIVQDEE